MKTPKKYLPNDTDEKAKTDLGFQLMAAEAVKRARLAVGKSQADFAKAVGTSQNQIWRLESGKLPRGASLELLERVAKACNNNFHLTLDTRAVVENDFMLMTAQAVKNARLANGKTQAEFAQDAGTSQVQISRLERGVLPRGPSIELLQRIAKASNGHFCLVLK